MVRSIALAKLSRSAILSNFVDEIVTSNQQSLNCNCSCGTHKIGPIPL